MALRIVIFLALVLVSFDAAAVTLLDDNREIVTINNAGTTSISPPVPFADWLVPGSQQSSVGESVFSGNGFGDAFSDTDFYINDSYFDVTFGVDSATNILLIGTLTGEDGDFGLGQSRVSLTRLEPDSTTVLFFMLGGSSEIVDFEFSDILESGIYRLRVYTILTPGGFDTTATWNFDAAFTAVPIPAAAWLLGAALSLLAAVKRTQ